MTDARPGLNRRRLGQLMSAAIDRLELDLRGASVVTEAASGAYVVTSVLAALAGADHVHALTRPTRHGSVDDVRAETLNLARSLGVAAQIEVMVERDAAIFGAADIITNTGHVRPIGSELLAQMKTTAVIPLMYEAWEFRPEDLDLTACARYGIAIAGTNERHPNIDVFSYLGILAVKLLLDGGVAVHGTHVLVLCDNPFSAFLERGLVGAGATVTVTARLADVRSGLVFDAIVVSLTPRWSGQPVLSEADTAEIARRSPGAVIAQLWGDLDRNVLGRYELVVCPPSPPRAGHMAVLLSDLGPDAVVRLQAGGLKVGEVLWRARQSGATVLDSIAALESSGYGHRLEQ